MADQSVLVSTGQKVDVSELTRSDGMVVERQRFTEGDPSNPALLSNLQPGTGEKPVLDETTHDLLLLILMELKQLNLTLSGASPSAASNDL